MNPDNSRVVLPENIPFQDFNLARLDKAFKRFCLLPFFLSFLPFLKLFNNLVNYLACDYLDISGLDVIRKLHIKSKDNRHERVFFLH